MLNDLRYAIRTLTASRGFTIAAVLTLALGIGANTAIFTAVYGVLLKPLPYPHPEALVRISEGRPGVRLNVSYPNFVDWRDRNRVFSAMAIFIVGGTAIVPDANGVPEVFPSANAEARLFPLLGVGPASGRLFTDADEEPAAPAVALISDRMWQQRFGRDPAVLGRTVTTGGAPATVVGVLRPGGLFQDVDVWTPFKSKLLGPMQLDRANHPGFQVMARLRDGIDLATARREMSGIAAALERRHPVSNRDMGVFVTPLLDAVAGGVRPALRALFAAVSVLLLIACANVANLLLARGLRRERETSIRAALGASRLRVMRLFLTEGLLLGAAGGTAGLLMAAWGIRMLRAVPGLVLPRAAEIAIDPIVLAFVAAVAILTAALFSLAPATHLSRVDVMSVLRLTGSMEATLPGAARMRAVLVAGEVALVVLLLSGALLMQRTLASIASIDIGFRAADVAAARLLVPPERYDSAGSIVDFTGRVLEAVGGGQVAGAAMAWPFDYTGASWSPNIDLPDRPFEPGREPVAQASAVTPGYFATMGIPLLKGRTFGPGERPGAPVAVIVNQSFADRFFPNEDPIGRRVNAVRIPQMQNMPIVGVVGDTRRLGMLKGYTPEIYVSYAQFPQSGATLVVRASQGSPLTLAGDLKARIAAVDPAVAVTSVRRVSDALAATYGDRRALAWLLSVFSSLALVLTILGVGSVVAFQVAQRRPEIGIRMALGAGAGGVLRLVLRRALVPVALGGAAGLVGVAVLSGLMRPYVFGVSPLDPLSTATALALVVAGASAAAYVPARRATRIDPVQALRAS